MRFSWSRLDHAIKVRVPIVLGVVLATVIITAAVSTPTRRAVGYSPEQPVAFSHQLHAGQMRVDCGYCHTGVESGRHAVVPSTAVCMNCHAVASVQDSSLIEPLLAANEEGRAIRWERIYRVPEFVYFAHNVHIARDIPCRTCHGRVEEMDVVRQAMPLSMSYCLDCHRNSNEYLPTETAESRPVGPEHCGACHR